MICAEREYEDRHGRPSEYDDDLEVLSDDEKIIIRFEIEEG